MSSINICDLSILVVEPSDTQRKIILKQLHQHGVEQVSQAKNITEALAIVELHAHDLVASAMYFEDGSALDLLHNIRANKKIADTSFMLVTSEVKRENLEEFKQSGVIAVLPKPFTHKHLETAIRSTIDLLSSNELSLDFFDVQDVRVLLVDDSRLARNHIKRVLSSLGLEKITEAVNGQQAINILNDNMFDLVVTDFNMPEVNGRELSRYIRAQSGQSHLPILMVTSESQHTHLANIEHDGVNAMCDKPFEPQYVKQLLYRLLNHEN